MKHLQRLGISLMLPVSIMPVAALLKGIGYWLDPVGWGANSQLAAFLIESGGAIIDNLPLLFAVAIAAGMTEEKEITLGLSAVACFMVLTRILSPHVVSLIMNVGNRGVSPAFYNSNNALIGILVGLIVFMSYERFHDIHLPEALSFFSGKRLIPLVSMAFTLLTGTVLLFVWPFLYNCFVSFGTAISQLGSLSAGLYGFFNRMLIPTGLHHALNSVFWFDVAGINDIGKYWGTVEGGIKGVTGMYQAGFFPIMMFGLPGAALAIYRCALPAKKKQIGALMFSAALASFLTGVTEPLEFMFMFVAPLLFFAHALLTGLMLYLAAAFQWLAGFSFSAGLIDYFLSFKAPFSNHSIMLIPLGMVCGIIYYIVFRFLIMRFDLMTPGREKEDMIKPEKVKQPSMDHDELAILLIDALGGRQNIIYAESCITRLRVELKDMNLADEQKILSLGVKGIHAVGKHDLQIVIGTEVQFVVDAINDILM